LIAHTIYFRKVLDHAASDENISYISCIPINLIASQTNSIPHHVPLRACQYAPNITER
jgi:hypothetical protein